MRESLLVFAVSIFAVEAGVTAYVYSASLTSGFSFAAPTDLFGGFWMELGLTLSAIVLSIYVLSEAQHRLEARLLARWAAQESTGSADRVAAHSSEGPGGWASDATLAAFGVVFFAESATLTVALLLSIGSGFVINISTNSIGEFWIEYPLVLAALPLAFYVLARAVSPLARGRTSPNFEGSTASGARARAALLGHEIGSASRTVARPMGAHASLSPPYDPAHGSRSTETLSLDRARSS